jgi:predicted nucleotidyltransferase
MIPPKINSNIFKKYKVKLAYLFGSHAKNTAVAESDFDIAVLFDSHISDLFEKSQRLGIEIQKLFPTEVDVRVLNDAPSLFKYEVISNSLLLYCKNENERIEFEVRSIKEYIDDQYMRDIYHQAVADKISKGVFQ